MPNVSGFVMRGRRYSLGARGGGAHDNWGFWADGGMNQSLSQYNSQYQYINELRVKSIISIGFIKLY